MIETNFSYNEKQNTKLFFTRMNKLGMIGCQRLEARLEIEFLTNNIIKGTVNLKKFDENIFFINLLSDVYTKHSQERLLLAITDYTYNYANNVLKVTFEVNDGKR